MWNNDWDGSGLVIDDYLFEGGENSQFHIVKLNRATGADGKVTVHPSSCSTPRAGTTSCSSDIGDKDVSIENSVAISGNTVYFANSGGLVQGWDISGLKEGKTPTRAFRFWTGDDTDASVVIDDEGFLYVGSEYERNGQRAREVGQIMKLDPRKPDNPLVWSVPDQDASLAGVWATPAIADGMVYVATNGGRLLGIDPTTARSCGRRSFPGPTWQSPVVVDDVLLMATATACCTPTTSTTGVDRRSCGRSSSAAASSRPRRCGRAASTSAPAPAASSPSAIDQPGSERGAPPGIDCAATMFSAAQAGAITERRFLSAGRQRCRGRKSSSGRCSPGSVCEPMT